MSEHDFTFDAPTADPLLDEPGGNGRPAESVLDRLRADLSRTVEYDPITLSVPGREGYSVRFDPNRLAAEGVVDRLASRATGRNEDRPDGDVLNALFAVTACVAVQLDGKDIQLDGETVTFRHPALWEAMGIKTKPTRTASAHPAVSAARKMYGSPFVLNEVVRKLLVAAGLDTDVEDDDLLDPTTAG